MSLENLGDLGDLFTTSEVLIWGGEGGEISESLGGTYSNRHIYPQESPDPIEMRINENWRMGGKKGNRDENISKCSFRKL